MKKSSKIVKSIALLLTGALLLAGCGKKETDEAGGTAGGVSSAETQEQSDGSQKTMGRYVEQQIELPSEVTGLNSGICYGDGVVRIPSTNGPDLVSNDRGESFTADPGLSQVYWDRLMSGSYINHLAVNPKGDRILTYYESAGEGTFDGTYTRELITAEDQVIPLDELPDEMMHICYGEDGNFYGSSITDNSIYRIDPKTGETVFLFQANGRVGYMAANGKYLFVAAVNSLQIYNLEENILGETDSVLSDFLQELLQQYRYTGSYDFLLAQGPEEESIYVLTEKGLYKHAMYGSTMEQLIDGGLSSIGDASLSFIGMIPLEDNEFLIQFSGSTLMRFTYNPDIPTVPDQTLRIYSLYEDYNVKVAAAAYRQQHPELYVKYEMGISGESGMTVDDALKNLTTELASGKGPDILIMDGIPYDSYVDKGVLMDIGEVVNGSGEELFDPIVDSFRRESKLYAVPAAFALSLLSGPKEEIGALNSLQDLASYLEQVRESKPEGSIFSFMDERGVLELLSLASSGAWVKEDGSLNKEAVAEYLTICRQIYEAQMSGVSEEDKELFMNARVGTVSEDRGLQISSKLDIQQLVTLGYVQGQKNAAGYFNGIMQDFSFFASLLRTLEAGFVSLPGQQSNTCIPLSVAAINNATLVPEEAKAFLQHFISSAFQSSAYMTGAPVNRTAYYEKQAFDSSDSEEPFGMMGMPGPDGDMISVNIYWPNQEELDSLNTIVEGITGVSVCDDRVYQAVLELGAAAVNGSAGIEETVDEIGKKVQLYLAE